MKHICGIIVLLFSYSLLSSSAFAQKTIRLASGEWPPYLSKTLPHYGYISHLITKAFESVDVKVEYGFFPWKRSLQYAREGLGINNEIWHGSVVWTYNNDKISDFLYTEPVLYEVEYLYYLKSNPVEWQEVEDLQGMVIGATSYSVYHAFDKAEQDGIIKMQRAGSDDDLIERLLKKRFDAVPMVKGFAEYYLRTKISPTDREKITYSPTVIFDREFHIILGKSNEDNLMYQGLFSKGLQILRGNGEYDKILKDLDNGVYDTPL